MSLRPVAQLCCWWPPVRPSPSLGFSVSLRTYNSPFLPNVLTTKSRNLLFKEKYILPVGVGNSFSSYKVRGNPVKTWNRQRTETKLLHRFKSCSCQLGTIFLRIHSRNIATFLPSHSIIKFQKQMLALFSRIAAAERYIDQGFQIFEDIFRILLTQYSHLHITGVDTFHGYVCGMNGYLLDSIFKPIWKYLTPVFCLVSPISQLPDEVETFLSEHFFFSFRVCFSLA